MPTVANNDGSLDPKYERELKQKQYEKVLKIMKSLAGPRISETYRNKFHLTSDGWNSTCTNEVLKIMFNTWEVDKDIYQIADDPKDGSKNVTFTCGAILIQDLLEEFSVSEITLYLYRAFQNDAYAEIKYEYQDPAKVEQAYQDKLKKFLMKFMSKFNMDKSIVDMLRPNAKRYVYTSELQCRILYRNTLINEMDMSTYGYLFSEEFTDYLLDRLKFRIEKAAKDNSIDEKTKKMQIRAFYATIYKLMDSRRSLEQSEMFKDKHYTVIKRACEEQIGNARYMIKTIREEDDEY